MKTTSVKLINWQGKKLEKLIAEKCKNDVLMRIAKNVKKNLREEVPVDTGNLRDSQEIGDVAEVGKSIGVNVGSDEDKAYYAPHVYYPGITRNYAGNDWITRALNKSESHIKGIINQAIKELNGISI